MDAIIDDHGRALPRQTADEATSLLGFLDYQRATLAWKCEGLDAAGLTATVGVSTMTLGGLLKHMAYVEHHWFQRILAGAAPVPTWDTVDWDADPDWDWNSAADDSPEELLALWHAAVERSRAHVAAVAGDGDVAVHAAKTWDDEALNLRWILIHMIEEYARHNGHADLLREAIDGETGE